MNQDMTRAFATLMCAYPNWNPSAQTLEFYAQMLADIPAVDLGLAITLHVQSSTFPPTVADLRKSHQAGCGIAPEEAWLEVARQVKAVGWCGRPSFSSPDVSKAVEALGGWKSLCSTPTADMGTARAQFMRCFGAYSKRTEHNRDMERLSERTGETLESFNRADLLEMDREELRQIDAGGL